MPTIIPHTSDMLNLLWSYFHSPELDNFKQNYQQNTSAGNAPTPAAKACLAAQAMLSFIGSNSHTSDSLFHIFHSLCNYVCTLDECPIEESVNFMHSELRECGALEKAGLYFMLLYSLYSIKDAEYQAPIIELSIYFKNQYPQEAEETEQWIHDKTKALQISSSP